MSPSSALLVVAVVAAGLLSPARSAVAAPRVPGSDDEVLERLPTRPGDPAQRELRQLRAALAENPHDAVRAIALARRHFDLAQAEGDPRHIGYGEAALRGVTETAGTQAELLVVRAQLAQYLHDFARALELLERALAIEPDDPEALAWRAAIRMVQADYAGARRDCEHLAQVASELLGAGCRAHVAAATGSLRAAYAQLLKALAQHPGARTSLRQWVSILLADMAQRLGDARAADAHYRAALTLAEPDQYLLAVYAEFLLDERRPAEAAALLRGWERSDTLLLLIARAAEALGKPGTARLAGMLQARYAEAALRGTRLHAQDEARFRLEFLGDAAGALQIAAQNWTDQREGADARILMEAALAAKSPQAARPVLDWLASSGFEDVRLARLAAALQALGR
jgi:tetratricopeptide (TPR) repeat protein